MTDDDNSNAPADAPAADIDLSPGRCAVLVPCQGAIERDCEAGLAELERRGYKVWRVYGWAAIDQGRNQMASDAIAEGFAETMWIDADIAFDADDVDRIRRHNLPICCGIYPQKGRRFLAMQELPGAEKIVFGRAGGLIEILYAGTGFLHVRREAYETIRERQSLPLCNLAFGNGMVPYFLPMILNHPERGPWYLAEDYSFSERARRSGFQIMADTTIRLRHIGKYGYSWEDAGADPQRYDTYSFHFK